MITRNTTKIRIAVVATIAALVITLAGCTTKAPETDPTTGPSTTQTDEPTETVGTEEPVVEFGVGDTVTNEGGSFIADLSASLPAGQRIVPIGDTGEYLIIDETQPLPAAYLDPILAEVTAGFSGEVADMFRTGHQVADTIESATGKTVVMYRGPGGDGAYFFFFNRGPVAEPTSPAEKAATATYLAAPPASFEAMVAMVTQIAASNGYDTTRLVFIQITA